MSEIGQIIVEIVPVLISAIVAYIQWRDKQEFERKLAAAETRIAVLETILIDHNLPVPDDT